METVKFENKSAEAMVSKALHTSLKDHHWFSSVSDIIWLSNSKGSSLISIIAEEDNFDAGKINYSKP